MKKKKEELLNSIYEKLKKYDELGIKITKEELEIFFNSLISKN